MGNVVKMMTTEKETREMKIMISFPPLKGKGYPSYIYPMVPASAATLLKANGYEVVWNDCIAEEWSHERFLNFVRAERPDLIAIETKTPVIKQHWAIIDELKKLAASARGGGGWELATVLMGDHVTALPEESFHKSRVDYVLTGGDYDFLLLNLCNYLKAEKEYKIPFTIYLFPPAEYKLPRIEPGIWYRAKPGKEGPSKKAEKISNTGHFKLDQDLNALPPIDRELTKWKLYDGPGLYKRTNFTYTMAGRGCPWTKCTSCPWTTLYPKFRVRSPENLLDEIRTLIYRYHIREVFDDTGTFPSGEWLDEFCHGMIKRRYHKKILLSCNFRFDYITPERVKLMRRAGFRLIKLEFESANSETLKKLNKGITALDIKEGCRIAKKAGLDVHLRVMLGYPWEGRVAAQNTLNLVKSLMAQRYVDMVQPTVFVPYPGSSLYKEAIENDWFIVDPADYEKFDMSAPILKTPDMSPQEVMGMYRGIYRSFLQPRFLLRQLARIRSPEDIRYLARGIRPAILSYKRFPKKVRRGRKGS